VPPDHLDFWGRDKAALEEAVSEQDVQHAKVRMRELEVSIRETKAE
jgi:hypothetical protein